jgi:hypothetical protein
MNSFIATEIYNRALAREGKHRIRAKVVLALLRLEGLEAKKTSSLVKRVKLAAEEKIRKNQTVSTVVTFDRRTWKWNLRAGYGLRDTQKTTLHIKNMVIGK